MNKHFSFPFFSLVLFWLLISLACNLASTASDPTAVPLPTSAVVVPETGPEIQHLSVPAELPTEESLAFGDQDTSEYAAKKIAPNGDRFTKGWFERPFNANTMDTYYPYLDIQRVAVFQDAEWFFGTIEVKGPDEAQGFPATYGLEIDLDTDGRGDFLFLAVAPAKGEWSVTGVSVYQDGKKDVGNQLVVGSDPPQTGDGFEDSVFDQGQGGDPDAAWSRLVDPNTIQIAFKKSLLGDDPAFMISGWAGMDELNPAWFDLNDHFTHEQAGAADPGFPLFYPIKELEKLDNTCRMPVGFDARGTEPGLCPTYIPKNAPPPPPGAPDPTEEPPIIIT